MWLRRPLNPVTLFHWVLSISLSVLARKSNGNWMHSINYRLLIAVAVASVTTEFHKAARRLPDARWRVMAMLTTLGYFTSSPGCLSPVCPPTLDWAICKCGRAICWMNYGAVYHATRGRKWNRTGEVEREMERLLELTH